ncbi:MAG: SUMF1/EgtB/PvdO family nonheme iron enzyme [Candidatus Cloacimonadaceae bacterium]|nr:SUMF1/EgtB/PvdO family nonheme iron enzyme [Candidatus Cloacimonadaceae bacterium]
MKQTAIIIFALWIGIMFAAPEFVTVKGGPMQVGKNIDALDAKAPTLKLDSFQMAKYEVTVDEFRKFVKDTGYKTIAEREGYGFGLVDDSWSDHEGLYWDNPGYTQTENHPVAFLSWYDAVTYCNWLSKKDKLKPVYKINMKKADPNNNNKADAYKWTVTWNAKANGYRLPTEAEWEFAARNRGAQQQYVWGTKVSPFAGDVALANLSYEYWNNEEDYYYDEYDDEYWDDYPYYEDGFVYTAPVGSFAPNPLGIYDLAGNVSELCWNWFELDYYDNVSQDGIKGPKTGLVHAHRGAAWCDEDTEWPVTYRRDVNEDYMSYQYFGLRLVKNAK